LCQPSIDYSGSDTLVKPLPSRQRFDPRFRGATRRIVASEKETETESSESDEPSAPGSAAESAEPDEKAYTPEEEAEITKRLEDLGYL
jgi:hypothetical protein